MQVLLLVRGEKARFSAGCMQESPVSDVNCFRAPGPRENGREYASRASWPNGLIDLMAHLVGAWTWSRGDFYERLRLPPHPQGNFRCSWMLVEKNLSRRFSFLRQDTAAPVGLLLQLLSFSRCVMPAPAYLKVGRRFFFPTTRESTRVGQQCFFTLLVTTCV